MAACRNSSFDTEQEWVLPVWATERRCCPGNLLAVRLPGMVFHQPLAAPLPHGPADSGVRSLAVPINNELVTHAIVHGNSQIEVHPLHTRGNSRPAVHDYHAGRPIRRSPAADRESGRGLELIDGPIEPYGGTRGVLNDFDCRGKTDTSRYPQRLTRKVSSEPAAVQRAERNASTRRARVAARCYDAAAAGPQDHARGHAGSASYSP